MTFIPYTSLYSTHATIFPLRRFPGRLTHAYYIMYMYIYIFRGWLDTAGRPRPRAGFAWWSYAVMGPMI